MLEPILLVLQERLEIILMNLTARSTKSFGMARKIAPDPYPIGA